MMKIKEMSNRKLNKMMSKMEYYCFYKIRSAMCALTYLCIQVF